MYEMTDLGPFEPRLPSVLARGGVREIQQVTIFGDRVFVNQGGATWIRKR